MYRRIKNRKQYKSELNFKTRVKKENEEVNLKCKYQILLKINFQLIDIMH